VHHASRVDCRRLAEQCRDRSVLRVGEPCGTLMVLCRSVNPRAGAWWSSLTRPAPPSRLWPRSSIRIECAPKWPEGDAGTAQNQAGATS
jgi:hypothetical protein